MKSSNWIASYLLKDTLCRLWENKLATIARVFVALLLSFSSILVLIAVSTESRTIQDRIESMGAYSILIRSREVCQVAHSPGMLPIQEFPSENTLLLKRHIHNASSERHKNVPIFTYQANSSIAFPKNPKGDQIFCLTDGEELQLFHVLGHEIAATALPSSGILKPLERNNALLIPEGFLPEIDRTSFHSIGIVQADSSKTFQSTLEKLQLFYQNSTLPPPHIESAQSLHQLLQELETHQTIWRLLLATLTGSTLTLVFGAIAFFMYRENRYVFSLIKSFGLSKKWIFGTVVLENLFVALSGAATGIFAAIASAPQLLAVFDLGNSIIFPQTDIQILLLFVLSAAILASLPTLKTLNQPIGEILS